MIVQYAHYDCPVDPDIEWEDEYECACNGECPACGMDDIEPVSWEDDGDPIGMFDSDDL